ncbi:MAG: aldehyde dehydrogenase family protein [Pseudomonadota bacterium]
MTKKIQCVSPIDGTIYAERPCLDFDAAAACVAKAHKAQAAWATEALDDRINLVRQAVDALGKMNDQIIPELAWQMGRPVRYSGEFGGVKERADHMIGIAQTALRSIDVELSDKFERYIDRIPHGVVLVVAPWNYPFLTAINTIVPALIAGNTVVLKHASQTLVAGDRLQSAFDKAGLPEGVFQNVVLGHDVTAGLLSSGSIDFANFTGSVPGGVAIEQAAAGTFTALGLELGGKDPGYVAEDADLDAAADTLIDAAMFNSGQCCCAIERIYVNADAYDEFIERAVAIVEGYEVGNPLDETTTMGPMAHERFARLVREHKDNAISRGAIPLIDAGRFPEETGAYVAPQILTNVTHDMTMMREETFGPIVGIMKVTGDDEAIHLMNDSDFGLTASLWTKDVSRAKRIGSQVQTGTVFMNRADYLDPALCWTGCKQTGRGGALSEIGYHNLTRPKSYHFKLGA